MTIKLFKSGIHTTMGLAALIAAVMVSGVLNPDEKPATEKRTAGNSVDFEHQQTASASSKTGPETQNKQANEAPGANRPRFDLLRVEKDGSVVVAGNAAPNTQVDIVTPDGKVIGKAQSGGQGDFALALEDSLKPGNHVLGLRSTDADGVKLRSAQTGIVRIPESEGDVLAMVSQDGEVSRILMKPTSFEPQSKSPSKREELASTSPTTPSEPPKVDKLPTRPKDKSILQHPVLVEAVEVEGQYVFVAGAVMQGELVRVYLDNVALGTARGTADNRFLLSKKFELKPGMHAIRVDVINEKTGGVWSRAEVGLQHELPEAVLAVRTNKSAEFAAHTQSQPADVEVAALSKIPEKPTATDPVATNETVSKLPAFPSHSGESDALLKFGADNKDGELQYAHTFQSAASNSTSGQGGSKFIRTGRAIIIKPGDSLWRISRRTYGNGMRYTTIFNANRNQIRDPNLIYVGQIFKIPEKVVQ